MVSSSSNNIVKSVTSNMMVSYEGGIFRISVNLSRPYRGRIPVSLTRSSTDIVGRRNWGLPKGVQWSDDGSALILRESMDAFVLLLPIENDALKETQEQVRLTIGGRAVNLSINDVPVAHVKETYSSVSRDEGRSFVLPVTLTRRSFYTSLPVALTGAPDSVMARSRWTFTHGVRWNYNYSHLLIPPNVGSFNLIIQSRVDNDKTSETLRLILGNHTIHLRVDEPSYRPIKHISQIVLVERFSKRFADVIREGSRIEFDVHISPGQERFFRLKFGGLAFSNFNWEILASGYRSNDYRYLGQGLFRITNSSATRITINAIIHSDQKYFGRLAGSISALPDNPGGSKAKAISIDDNNAVVERARRYLPSYYREGYTVFVKELRQQMRHISTFNGKELLDDKMDNHRFVNGSDFKLSTQGKTVRQVMSEVQAKTAEKRLIKMNATGSYFSRLYTDLKIENFSTSAINAGGVLRDATDYLNSVSKSLSSALDNSIKMRQVMAEILGSYDETEAAGSYYLDPKAPGAYHDLLKDAELRFNDYFDGVESQFEKIRMIYAEREAANRDAAVWSFVSALFSGIAVLASIGFTISNWRAAIGQWTKAKEDRNITRLTTKQFFEHALNGPAAVASILLGVTNIAQMIMESLKSAGVGTSGFGKFYGEAKSFAHTFDQTTAAFEQRLEKFTDSSLRMLHYILFNGGAGDADEIVIQKTNVKADQHKYRWEDVGRNVFVKYEGFVVAWWGAPFGFDSFTHTYFQYLWGIRKTPENERKFDIKVPLVLDLTGNGFHFTPLSSTPLYDANHDGRRDRMAWIGAGTALLAYDVDGDGEIKRSDEISFVSYKEGAKTDLEGLTAFDSNGDSLFDGRDLLWHRFGVWQDSNGDGVNQAGEFVSLEQAGLLSISLVSDHMASTVGDVLIYGRSIFTRRDGTTGLVGDVGFRYISS